MRANTWRSCASFGRGRLSAGQMNFWEMLPKSPALAPRRVVKYMHLLRLIVCQLSSIPGYPGCGDRITVRDGRHEMDQRSDLSDLQGPCRRTSKPQRIPPAKCSEFSRNLSMEVRRMWIDIPLSPPGFWTPVHSACARIRQRSPEVRSSWTRRLPHPQQWLMDGERAQHVGRGRVRRQRLP